MAWVGVLVLTLRQWLDRELHDRDWLGLPIRRRIRRKMVKKPRLVSLDQTENPPVREDKGR